MRVATRIALSHTTRPRSPLTHNAELTPNAHTAQAPTRDRRPRPILAPRRADAAAFAFHAR
eukprot:3137266-Prymnesium_polylepis.1